MRISLLLVVVAVVVVALGAFILLRKTGASRTQSSRPTNLQPGPIRHLKLPDALDARVRRFEPVFAEVYPRTHAEWLDGFLRDADPESEIAVWETIASAYKGFTEKRPLSLEAKKEVFGLLLVRSSGDAQQTLSGAKLSHLSLVEAEEVLRYYSAAPQPIRYEKR